MPHHYDLTPEWPVEEVQYLFSQPPGPWPAGFEGYPNVIEAFRRMFHDEAAAMRVSPPSWVAKRGIVICGGGWRFFPSIYVTVRIIRAVGCKLPIQVWYLGDWGEFDIRMMQSLEGHGVGWINANAYLRDNRIWHRTVGGWEIKPFAAAFAPFETVISLDADCYPTYDPEAFLDHPEFQRVGACFWPDQSPLLPGQYDRFGVPRREGISLESGQFVVDKSRHWRPLWLACWLNSFSDYVYKHIYGDKDTFLLAWQKAGNEFCLPTTKPRWDRIAFLQMDFLGRTLFVHRTRDKFRMSGSIDGRPIPTNYMTEQWNEGPLYVPTLPNENLAHQFARLCELHLRPELHVSHRANSWDIDIFKSVFHSNEYRLPAEFTRDDVIVDVGAHIGSFAIACLERGAGRVICIEPHPDSAALLRRNTARFSGMVEIIEAAIGEADGTATLAPDSANVGNTGGDSLFRSSEGIIVKTVRLADILAKLGPVRLLKLDCEGGEYAALKDGGLDSVVEICGEGHPGIDLRGESYGVEKLDRLLEQNGFTAQLQRRGDFALFWGCRHG